jgi:protein tyrosine/serine phosphatase
MALPERHLAWDGCLNVRDLGGHKTEDGGETRFGAVVRADSVRQLTDEGWAQLTGYGVSRIVDLRMDAERAEDPSDDVPVEVLHLPFFHEDSEVFREVDEAALAAPDLPTATRNVYLIFLERFRENVAAAVKAVGDAPEGVVVVHCAGGKDRTGLVTAFLLKLAGVSDEDVAGDYALSEERLKPRHERWLAEAETETERKRLRRMLATPAASMLAVLHELERRYGSVEGYLEAGGLTDADIARVRRRLR